MRDLYPTPARLALLRQMDDGNVWEDWTGGEPGEVRVHAFGRRDRATAKVREMKSAEWCMTDPADDDMHWRRITLTVAGRAVLAQEEG